MNSRTSAAFRGLNRVGHTGDRFEHAQTALAATVVERAPRTAGQREDRRLDFFRFVGNVRAEIRCVDCA
jgi:hypothetical protein